MQKKSVKLQVSSPLNIVAVHVDVQARRSSLRDARFEGERSNNYYIGVGRPYPPLLVPLQSHKDILRERFEAGHEPRQNNTASGEGSGPVRLLQTLAERAGRLFPYGGDAAGSSLHLID